ncbi:MAG TPA: ABC transporter substrate-binding protein [Paenirhodobacter sp.]
MQQGLGLIGAVLAIMVASGVTGTAAAQGLIFPPDVDARFHWQDYQTLQGQDLRGQRLTILGTWLGQDKALFDSVIAYFEAATGADVVYEGSSSFEQQIVIRTQAGAPPDLAIVPQPGLAADLARQGFLRPLAPDLGGWLLENYAAGDSWRRIGTYRDPQGTERLYAFPYKAEIKSLVWYVPENLAEAGYPVPETYQDLRALTERIVADGGTPWCIALGSGGATGWPATDWVEDLMLRLNTPADYDDWVAHEIRFQDPRVLAAIEAFGWFATSDSFVDGGRAAVAGTDFRDSAQGLFTAPPRCYLLHQASFIASFFPAGTELGRDADFFYFPTRAQAGPDRPVLGAGTLFVKLTDNPASDAFIRFLTLPLAHEIWMAQTGFATPHKGVNPQVYATPTQRKLGEILRDATVFRFDGSDLMPGAIGAGAFWRGMVDYVGGQSAAQVARQIDSRWDDLQAPQ